MTRKAFVSVFVSVLVSVIVSVIAWISYQLLNILFPLMSICTESVKVVIVGAGNARMLMLIFIQQSYLFSLAFYLPRLVKLRMVVVRFGVSVKFCALLVRSIALILEDLPNFRVLSHHVITVSVCPHPAAVVYDQSGIVHHETPG